MILALLLATAAAAAAVPPPELQRLVGACWRADLDRETTDTHCFVATAAGGVVDTHVVARGGAEIYRGRTDYVGEGGRIAYRYSNARGPVAAGVVRADAGGLRFEARTGTLRARWRWGDADTYSTEEPGNTTVFRRVR